MKLIGLLLAMLFSVTINTNYSNNTTVENLNPYESEILELLNNEISYEHLKDNISKLEAKGYSIKKLEASTIITNGNFRVMVIDESERYTGEKTEEYPIFNYEYDVDGNDVWVSLLYTDYDYSIQLMGTVYTKQNITESYVYDILKAFVNDLTE